MLEEKIRQTPFAQDYVQYLISDVSIGIELLKDNGLDDMQSLIGPENSLAAKNQAPNSIRALFGKDNLRNAIHASESAEYAVRESDFFFNQGMCKGKKNCPTSAILTNCSLLLIKPHII